MKRRNRRRRRRTGIRFLWIAVAIVGTALIGTAVWVIGYANKDRKENSPENLLVSYIEHIPEAEYEEMYGMLDVTASGNIKQEDFIKRNSDIYEGIEAQNMEVEVLEYDKKEKSVKYRTSFDTAAGNISFENEAAFQKGEDGYKLVWDDSLIFPKLEGTDKVRVSATPAERGEILDRNGRVLAGKGTASSIGIVPGRLEDRDSAVQKIAEILELEQDTIEKKLSEQWVKDDSFVPLKTVHKVEEIDLMSDNPDEEVLEEQERQEKLLDLEGDGRPRDGYPVEGL